MELFQTPEDILRVIQDLHKFAGALRLQNSNASTPTSGPVAGPSNARSASRSSAKKPVKPRTKKVVAPPPVDPDAPQSAVAAGHAEMLATKWLSPAKLKELVENEGLVYKKGKFSAIEEHQIKDAISRYADSRKLSQTDIDGIVYAQGSKVKEANQCFWSEITRAVPLRPIIAVYHHVRRDRHPLKAQGKWTPEEDEMLSAAVAELGQKWEMISPRVGRMSSDCRDRYRNHIQNRDTRAFGSWTVQEEQELIEIMTSEANKKGKDLDSDVFWGEVSEKMGNKRSRQQIRIKWTDGLSKKAKHEGDPPRWSAQDAYILVHKVASLNVHDDTEIDWKLLPDPDWDSWSAHQLQRRWQSLKRTIKNHEEMSFAEILEILKAKKAEFPSLIAFPKPRAQKRPKIMKDVIAQEHLEGDEIDELLHDPSLSAMMNPMGLGNSSMQDFMSSGHS
ncbi:hypothetical protein BOTBODRAFT_108677 [Botryobasidium botryosum FD-172 SS1]|uniref:Myb-like domain-containing protein n=1 Tax=Botryobasidium botryosum (strain FD-172 SS1) TaxID=930990 RepID=A0A067MU82_BOTB1|nr:hypothetical protein BOTBODRAFT_108677 [Botryobasidium botryosum FD-172 SS1]